MSTPHKHQPTGSFLKRELVKNSPRLSLFFLLPLSAVFLTQAQTHTLCLDRASVLQAGLEHTAIFLPQPPSTVIGGMKSSEPGLEKAQRLWELPKLSGGAVL